MKPLRPILFITASFGLMTSFQNCEQPGDLTLKADMGEIEGSLSQINTPSPVLVDDSIVVGEIQQDEDIVNPGQNSDEDGEREMPGSPSAGSESMPPANSDADGSPSQPGQDGSQASQPPANADGDSTLSACAKDERELTDVRINVSSVEASNVDGVEFVVDQPAIATYQDNVISFVPTEDVKINDLKLVLNADENAVLFSDSSYANLFVPSGAQSGLKVKLAPTRLEKGKRYHLHLEFKLEDQIVVAGKKCIFKPVVHSGKIQPAS